ncbi:MAG: isochorismatase family protein [Pirellulaceae bacterium]|nr:isochorismatase family protein [Pirellulaceae bacterium]
MASLVMPSLVAAEPLKLTLRDQRETSPGSGRHHQRVRGESWLPNETAIIVCDVWDVHHSLNAVRRVEQFAPRLNEVLTKARGLGVTIIHSPSDCMAAYENHPARVRAEKIPVAANLPADVRSWCSRIPAEELAVYPLDQSDGGDDDDPAEHAVWAKKLIAMGRNPGIPWKSQSKLIEIDSERDFISDRGDEVWNVLEQRQIKNVILAGVHTNMCVLGRPFGLRQMVRNGKHVVLMRDMTDTMYNPGRWPYVSHFTGNDLIIAHIERFVCPTITSDQVIGGSPFRFAADKRPHLAIVMAEDEYETSATLPRFAFDYLGKSFHVSFVFGSDSERNSIPGLEVLESADAALFSVRRRVLTNAQMTLVKKFVAAGKPVIGIRTASHAFALRKQDPPAGFVDWPEFDAQVFGGNYHNHYGNKLVATIRREPGAKDNPILAGSRRDSFATGGSLYKTSPLAKGADVLLWGKVDGEGREPVAWTFRRSDGGRSFYTSLGHIDDFDNPEFLGLLLNGIHWAVGNEPSADVTIASASDFRRHWSQIKVPAPWESAAPALSQYDGVGWYRCVLRISQSWLGDGFEVELAESSDERQAWFNGRPLKLSGGAARVPRDWVELNDANLLVVRVSNKSGPGGLSKSPRIRSSRGAMELAGKWQFRIGDDEQWRMMPLPARYGAPTDIIFEP